MSKNCVHISAGPVQGLVELIRFNSDYRNDNKILSYKDFSFGKLLKEKYSTEKIKQILDNKIIDINDKKVSLFDLTEGKNSQEAYELIQMYF